MAARVKLKGEADDVRQLMLHIAAVCSLLGSCNCVHVNIYLINGHSCNLNVCFDRSYTERRRQCAFTLHGGAKDIGCGYF